MQRRESEAPSAGSTPFAWTRRPEHRGPWPVVGDLDMDHQELSVLLFYSKL